MFEYKNIRALAMVTLFFCLLSGSAYAQEYSSDDYYAMAKKEGNEKKNFKKATEYSEKASELAPLDMDIREYLGKCYLELGQLDKARIVLLEVLQRSPKRVDARHYLLNIDIQQKRYASAVCYANELLEITPYSKTLWFRKIELYHLMDNSMEANRETRRLYQIFPEDEEIRYMYNNVLKEDARKMNKSGDITNAVKQYEDALRINKRDQESYLNLINLYIRAGNYPAALSTADRGLNELPGNKAILDKKVGILEEMHEYPRAMDIVQEQIRRGDSGYYRQMMKYLTAEAARHYKNSDPYELYGKLYEQDKSNKEARDYRLNTAISRGYFADAQEMLTPALKSDPTNKELLSKQLYVYESRQDKQGQRKTVEQLYRLYPGDSDVRDKYDAIKFDDAKAEFATGNYKAALPVFARLSTHPVYGKPASNYLFATYLAQKSYPRALEQIDRLIDSYPGEQEYILKKIDLLADMGNYEEAYFMAETFAKQNPDNDEYRYMLNDISGEYIKQLIEKEDYGTMKLVADKVLASGNKDLQAYNYAISARLLVSDYNGAQELIQQALLLYPDNKELRLKEAGVYSQAGNHQKAVEVLQGLVADYPYNSTYKSSLVEEMLLDARQKEQKEQYLDAIKVYNEILMLKPNDTVAPIRLANLYIRRQEYVEAMLVVDRALTYNAENQDLIYLKGVIYELQGDYKNARLWQGKYIPPAHKLEEHKEHLDYLEALMLKNQAIMSYLKATNDSAVFSASVATFEYMRFERNNVYVGRINYAARTAGTGVQGEIDWYHTFKDKSYILANAGIANRYFSDYKLGLSFYMPFRKTYEGELGLRFAGLPDGRNLFTGILGLSKTYANVWLNARVSLLNDGEDMYHTILGQARFYMRNQKDYAQVMASVGTAPEDQKLDFQTNTLLSYVNTMVGAGYFHYLSNRTSVGVLGNWYNFKVTENTYLNQYNLFLTLRTKF
ncbi:MAG: tetratricopeptide repeat protein [Flavobacterium sp.]